MEEWRWGWEKAASNGAGAWAGAARMEEWRGGWEKAMFYGAGAWAGAARVEEWRGVGEGRVQWSWCVGRSNTGSRGEEGSGEGAKPHAMELVGWAA